MRIITQSGLFLKKGSGRLIFFRSRPEERGRLRERPRAFQFSPLISHLHDFGEAEGGSKRAAARFDPPSASFLGWGVTTSEQFGENWKALGEGLSGSQK